MNVLVSCHSHELCVNNYVVDIDTWKPSGPDEQYAYDLIKKAMQDSMWLGIDTQGYYVQNTLHEMERTHHSASRPFPCHVDRYVTIKSEI